MLESVFIRFRMIKKHSFRNEQLSNAKEFLTVWPFSLSKICFKTVLSSIVLSRLAPGCTENQYVKPTSQFQRVSSVLSGFFKNKTKRILVNNYFDNDHYLCLEKKCLDLKQILI